MMGTKPGSSARASALNYSAISPFPCIDTSAHTTVSPPPQHTHRMYAIQENYTVGKSQDVTRETGKMAEQKTGAMQVGQREFNLANHIKAEAEN